MFIFSVGTVPLMLTFSMTAIFLPRRFIPIMVKASAILVMFLGVVTFGRAAALAGVAIPSLSSVQALSTEPVPSDVPAFQVEQDNGLEDSSIQLAADKKRPNDGSVEATLENGTQSVITIFGSNNYVPIVVKAGIPLKWTIRIAASDLNGCNATMVIPSWGIRKRLVPGDNIIEGTPGKTGTFAYSCWMGMIRSKITVAAN